jgi:hypothetical protein
MEKSNEHPRSHLFTIRVWEEEVGIEQSEWGGKVQIFPSGEVRYFHDWTTLAPLLLSMLTQESSSPNDEI